MESNSITKKAKVFRSKQEIKRLLMEHAQSGLSVKSFCAGLHIDDGTFYHWKKKYTKDTGAAGKTGFAPVEIVPSACTLFAEVGSIKIYQPVSAAYLKELLA
ncbi:IS66 family insertion sequence element accessory protein TnpA [Longitalea arenae]|uniref:IS66 family insertion sequence element accessory protein TnpA n=1 Tax=Longitalea arenae TaxID=2812558 RepID=UPI0019678444|nr:transposase [Longitalea arenae]